MEKQEKEKALVDQWTEIVNNENKEYLTTNNLPPYPNCIGHMHRGSRWITPTSTKEQIKDNAQRHAKCLRCPHNKRCYRLSANSYAFQTIPREEE